jgi:peroxiredoxin
MSPLWADSGEAPTTRPYRFINPLHRDRTVARPPGHPVRAARFASLSTPIAAVAAHRTSSVVCLARADNISELPPDLPVPEDDGAADHLPGMRIPPMALPTTAGGEVRLDELPGRTVLFCYPRTGRPDEELPPGWNSIPGARGCTPEACGFRDRHEQFADLGVRVLALSTQETDYQREMTERLEVPFEVLSDAELRLVRALRLPTFETSGWTLVKRLTLVIRDGEIEHVFYPVFPPDTHAGEVLDWLRR